MKKILLCNFIFLFFTLGFIFGTSDAWGATLDERKEQCIDYLLSEEYINSTSDDWQDNYFREEINDELMNEVCMSVDTNEVDYIQDEGAYLSGDIEGSLPNFEDDYDYDLNSGMAGEAKKADLIIQNNATFIFVLFIIISIFVVYYKKNKKKIYFDM